MTLEENHYRKGEMTVEGLLKRKEECRIYAQTLIEGF